MNMKIAILQVKIFSCNHQFNLSNALDFIEKAINNKCNFIVLPELWLSGFCYDKLDFSVEQTKNAIVQLKHICNENNVYVTGSYLTQTKSAYYNTQIIIGPEKSVYQPYKKINLMHSLHEHKHFRPGHRIIINNLGDFKLGSAICYDLRFPSLFWSLRAKGMNVIILTAEWPKERIDHWKILTRARAIENQSYMIAANGIGNSNNVVLGGCSQIIDPWGNVLSEGSTNQQQLIVADISSEEISNVRSRFPIIH